MSSIGNLCAIYFQNSAKRHQAVHIRNYNRSYLIPPATAHKTYHLAFLLRPVVNQTYRVTYSWSSC